MSCAEVMEVLQAYLDGEVDTARARQVAGHLSKCGWCDTESQVYDRIRTSLAGREIEVDPQVLRALTDFGRNLARDGSNP
ncbi:MAG: zf-HC2 domain-containing protein [Actinomycetota bacterium]